MVTKTAHISSNEWLELHDDVLCYFKRSRLRLIARFMPVETVQLNVSGRLLGLFDPNLRIGLWVIDLLAAMNFAALAFFGFPSFDASAKYGKILENILGATGSALASAILFAATIPTTIELARRLWRSGTVITENAGHPKFESAVWIPAKPGKHPGVDELLNLVITKPPPPECKRFGKSVWLVLGTGIDWQAHAIGLALSTFATGSMFRITAREFTKANWIIAGPALMAIAAIALLCICLFVQWRRGSLSRAYDRCIQALLIAGRYANAESVISASANDPACAENAREYRMLLALLHGNTAEAYRLAPEMQGDQMILRCGATLHGDLRHIARPGSTKATRSSAPNCGIISIE